MARRTLLSSLTAAEIRAELRRRERRIKTLGRRRDRLLAKAAELAREINAQGGYTKEGTVRRKPRNQTPLVETLRVVLKEKQMRVKDAAAAVLKAGHVSKAADFRVVVNAALANNELFKRVGRGIYTAR